MARRGQVSRDKRRDVSSGKVPYPRYPQSSFGCQPVNGVDADSGPPEGRADLVAQP